MISSNFKRKTISAVASLLLLSNISFAGDMNKILGIAKKTNIDVDKNTTIDIEHNKNINIDVDVNIENQIIKLYIATFNRAPDKGGLEYWKHEMKTKGWKIEDVASSFFDQSETQKLYGNADVDTLINRVYQNVLGRKPDKGGFEYWKHDLTKGIFSKQKFIIAVINGAKDDDAKLLNNKLKVGRYFALEENLEDPDLAKEVVSHIDANEDSIEKAKLKVKHKIKGLIGIIEEEKKDKNITIYNPKCNIKPILDDSNYHDVLPDNDIKWVATGTSVEDIAKAFNRGRAKDSTVDKELVMPPQDIWNKMNEQERALYLLNRERVDRGIKPFEGFDKRVIKVAQKYAELLYKKSVFGHSFDGSPWDRLDKVEEIEQNKDFFAFGENLYADGAVGSYTRNPIAKAIYTWIYADSKSSWKHREFCLARLKDNSGEKGAEGIIGVGVKQGDEYGFFAGYKSTIIVLNAFDPSPNWDFSKTIRVPLCFKGIDTNITIDINATIDINTTTEGNSTTEIVITTDDNSTSTENNLTDTNTTISIDTNSSTTSSENNSTNEDNNSSTENNSTNENNTSTTENNSTNEDNNSSTENNSTNENNTSTTENNSTNEDNNTSS